jgi:phosphatidylserine decarboxylase
VKYPSLPEETPVAFLGLSRVAAFCGSEDPVSALKTSLTQGYRYPYEEFADHVKAMRTVREWEYTSRFGHIGNVQTSRANNARVLDYFADSYGDQKEAVHKAELFLSIYDYIGRHAHVFSRKEMVEKLDGTLFSVDPALLRAAHHVFTVSDRPVCVDPKKVLTLARAFRQLDSL